MKYIMTKTQIQSFLKEIKKAHKQKKKKRPRDESASHNVYDKPQKKKSRKREDDASKEQQHTVKPNAIPRVDSNTTAPRGIRKRIDFPHKYVLAPMVGASELAFRLLCRKYGTQLAYTPMMSAHKFAHDVNYRQEEFQICNIDRPLVCHFAASTPEDFAAAAQFAEPFCDAIDLNLGCPQRTAYVGHFGSYLLDPPDRALVCDMVRAAASAVSIPVFCKIRLLGTLDETIKLCQQLEAAGASLIAIHARYRASWERHGPGARDGPAHLDQVTEIRKQVSIPILTNGNTITYQDVKDNMELTHADGLMSAEGILDNPALFLPRYGSREETDKPVEIPVPCSHEKTDKKRRKLKKKLHAIERVEDKLQSKSESALTEKEKKRLSKKEKYQMSLQKLETASTKETKTETTTLGRLYEVSDDKLRLAFEYLDLATIYPVKIRSVIFHTRRMLKDKLVQYQLLDDCLHCESIDEVRAILKKIEGYQANPASFIYDREKAKQEKEALERKKREEGKRKAYEARMIRKAKREGKSDLNYYLRIGAELPTRETIEKLKGLPRDEVMTLWKKSHSQHCLSFHLDPNGCTRGRTCAFLHVDVLGAHSFVEKDEVAG